MLLACVAGGIRERASARRRSRIKPARDFASGEAASEIPALHILYGFCLPPTFIAFDELIKLGVSMWKWVLASELEGNTDNSRDLK